MRPHRPSSVRRVAALALAAGVAALAAAARADTITLGGSTIPMRGCTVQDLRSGRLLFLDARGRRQWRELDDVAAIGFEGLPALDEAEARLARGEKDVGLIKMLQALLDADDEPEQVWIHARLARVHDARSEYVQAAGHAAAVFLLRDEPYWRVLEPIRPPEKVDYPAARESIDRLRSAQRSVRRHELQAVIERMIAVVEPRFAAAKAAYGDAPLPTALTVSGIPVESIRRGRLDAGTAPIPTPAEPAPPKAAPKTPAREGPGPRPDAPRPTRVTGRDAPDAIDARLDAGRTAEALAMCERVARRPGPRPLDRFLHQYGRALAAEGRPRDAAVMFMRCAVLYESSPFAAPSLAETARIYRDHYGDEATARRLRARADALRRLNTD
jgi:hypothetical protein